MLGNHNAGANPTKRSWRRFYHSRCKLGRFTVERFFSKDLEGSCLPKELIYSKKYFIILTPQASSNNFFGHNLCQ